jgi:formate hydrogenlyase subunit 4
VTIFLSLVAQVLHIALMIIAAAALAAATAWLDARLSGLTGPPLLSQWRDLVRLSRKTAPHTENLSALSHFAPAVAMGATLAAAALVPSFTLGMALSPLADMLVIVTLLTIARVAIALAALDSGAPLPGFAQQGASTRAVFAEPALMLAIVALALMGGTFNLDLVIGQQREGVLLPAAASAVTLTALLALLLADISLPAGATDEAFGGIDLAMVQVATWLRRLVWIDLIGGLFLPIGLAAADSTPIAWLAGLGCWGFKLTAAAIALSGFQTLLGRIPHHSLPDVIGVAALLALLAVVMVLASTGLA